MHTNFTSMLGQALGAFREQLRRARRGNVAMIFALVAVPIVIAGGAGIDLSRALAVRGKLYTAVDAAALAVASKTGITQTEANTLGQQYFNANYKLNDTFGTPAGVNVVLANQSVTVTVQSDMPTTLMNVAGFQKVNLTASSNVVWGQNKIWVGLALDNTGSMCQSDTNTSTGGPCPTPGTNTKIYALKAATKSLLTMFQTTAVNAGDVQVSLIPFARDVKVDPATYGNATWIDWTDWDEDHGSCTLNGQATSHDNKSDCNAAASGTCSVSGYTTQNTCQNAGTCSMTSYTTQSTCQNGGTCSVSGYTSQSSCQNAGTCNISGNNSKSSCEADRAYMCSLSGYNNQNSCQSAGTCSIAGYSTQSTCNAAYNGYVCKINGVNYTDAPKHSTQTECQKSANGICSKAQYNTKNTCQNNNGTWHVGVWTGVGGTGVWTAGVWSRQYGTWTATPGTWTQAIWTAAPGIWTPTNGVWTADHTGWQGCIEDRGNKPATSTTNSGYDIVNTAPGTPPETKFPAVGTSGCPVATVMGLGYNWTSLDTKVDSMVASGNTNQTIGLAWAWHSISQGDPLTPPSLPSNTARHIIILSDGENTENAWYGSSEKSKIDDRMLLLCNNAKADGVTVWAVFVNIAGTAGNANSMKNCATGGATGGKYIEVTSASGIGNAFNVIGQQITNLRVAH